MPRDVVIRCLRLRGAPILYFGESQKAAENRLRKLQIDHPELKEGWKNDFQSAMNKVNEELVAEIIHGKSKDQAAKLNVAMPDAAEEKTWEQIVVSLKPRLSIQLAQKSISNTISYFFHLSSTSLISFIFSDRLL